MSVWRVIRWPLVPLCALAAMVLGELGSQSIGLAVFGRWSNLFTHPELTQGLTSGIAAICMGVTAWWVAPTARRAVVIVTFVAGCALAWKLLGVWWYPEGHPLAYQRSFVPLELTIGIGAVTCAVLWWLTPWWPGDALARGEVTRRDAVPLSTP